MAITEELELEERDRPELVDAAAARLEAEPAELGGLGLLTLLVGVLLPLTDFFIVNVALPTIDRDLQASSGMLQLVVAGYAIAYALLLVVGGRLGDAIGRRRLFLIGMGAFTLTSLVCGIAPSIGVLVAARALQGGSAAMMLPQVLSTIQATTAGERRARALGLYAATGGVGAVLGQLLGGLLITANIAGTGWRPIFLVNVPVGLVGVLFARKMIPETRSPDPAPVDTRGTLLLALSVLALLIPLTEGRSLGWPAWTIVLLAIAPLAAVAFGRAEMVLERSGGIPLVPFSVLRVASMRRGLLVAIPFFTGFGGYLFVYALALQDGAGFSPLRTGVTLLPMAVGFLGASLCTARLLARFGRRVMTAGSLLQGTGFVGLALGFWKTWPHLSSVVLVPGMLVAGVGLGLVLSPLFGVVLSRVPPRVAGVGSGVLATTQQSSLALGVATLGSLYLTTSAPAELGADVANLMVLSILVVIAVLVAVMTRKLPG